MTDKKMKAAISECMESTFKEGGRRELFLLTQTGVSKAKVKKMRDSNNKVAKADITAVYEWLVAKRFIKE